MSLTKFAFSKALKELRFHMCQTGQGSAATRHVSLLPFEGTQDSSVQTED